MEAIKTDIWSGLFCCVCAYWTAAHSQNNAHWHLQALKSQAPSPSTSLAMDSAKPNAVPMCFETHKARIPGHQRKQAAGRTSYAEALFTDMDTSKIFSKCALCSDATRPSTLKLQLANGVLRDHSTV
eukprot:3554379-Amphidinium_carterae.1